jgi:GH24 family phage-related lysozyme (muramidase)
MADIQSSDRAILLIVTEEDGDQNYYLKTEAHFSWPGGASGPTVGIGYDCGYSTAAQIEADWSPYIDSERVAVLKTAAGHTGGAGEAFTAAHRNAVTISWAESLAQFKGHELPKWEAITRAHLPNCDKLSGDSFGALVSLAYNRGPSFDAAGDHYREMRAIKADMEAENFAAIPAQFLSMRRLWPVGKDLWNRRGHEAILFRDGLSPPPAAVVVPAPPVDHSTEALQAALNTLGADPKLGVDGRYGSATRAAVKVFQHEAGLADVDGIPGTDTWTAIEAKLKAPPVS